MTENPYLPPQSDVAAEPPPAADAPMRLPFEDPATFPGLWDRIRETFRWMLVRREEAGAALGGSRDLGGPIRFYALLPLPLGILQGLIVQCFPLTPFWVRGPVARPEGPALVFALAGVLLGGPIVMALLLGLGGLALHAGLWMTGGTREGLGLTATYRAFFYAYGVALVLAIPLFPLQWLPGIMGALAQILVNLLGLLSLLYVGIMLAPTHRTATWRGVLGALAIPLILFCCCATCVGTAFAFGGSPLREAFESAMRGGR